MLENVFAASVNNTRWNVDFKAPDTSSEKQARPVEDNAAVRVVEKSFEPSVARASSVSETAEERGVADPLRANSDQGAVANYIQAELSTPSPRALPEARDPEQPKQQADPLANMEARLQQVYQSPAIAADTKSSQFSMVL